MATEKEQALINFAESQVGQGYIWGSKGKTLTETLLASYVKANPTHVDESVVSKWLGKKTYDCASFISSCFATIGITITSVGVSSQWKKTKWADSGTIDTIPKDRVCCVYREDASSNPMAHGGVYLGNGYVIDARGSKLGVIKRKLSAYKWSHWAIPQGMDYQKEEEVLEVSYQAEVVSSNGGGVRMRSEASTSGSILKTLPVGTVVDVIEESDGWTHIVYNGTSGYMMSEFLAAAGSETAEDSDILADKAYYIRINCSDKAEAELFLKAFKKAKVYEAEN